MSASTHDVAPEDVALRPRDWVAIGLPGLIWGSSFYLIAESLESFAPFLVAWLRIGFGMVVVAAVPQVRERVAPASWPRLAVLGTIWMAVPLSLFAFAQERVSSSVTGMLNGATPIFTAIVAVAILRRVPPVRQLAGLAVGLAGVVMIASPSWSEGSSSAGGVLMILAALSCYGVALNLAGPLQRRLGALPVIGRAQVVAFVLVAPFGLAALGGSGFSWPSAIAVVVLGAFGTGLAFVLMAANAGRYGSTRAASTTYVTPGVALLLGLLLRGEDVEVVAICGSAVALAGAYLVNTAVRSSR